MSESLAELEQQRAAVLRQIAELGDFRPGSISGTGGRCGTTYKAKGKTVSESFPTPAAQRKAEREIEAFRSYRQLEWSFVQVNEKICQARPVEDTLAAEENKRPKRSRPKSPAK